MISEGSCLCGAVRFTVDGPLRDVLACHCTQCRKTSGHHVAATSAPRSALRIEGAAAISWHTSSPGVQRGFCGTCGSHLFWDRAARDEMSIFMGAFDVVPALRLSGHIHCAQKGAYYEIAEDHPQWPGARETERCG